MNGILQRVVGMICLPVMSSTVFYTLVSRVKWLYDEEDVEALVKLMTTIGGQLVG